MCPLVFWHAQNTLHAFVNYFRQCMLDRIKFAIYSIDNYHTSLLIFLGYAFSINELGIMYLPLLDPVKTYKAKQVNHQPNNTRHNCSGKSRTQIARRRAIMPMVSNRHKIYKRDDKTVK